MPPPLNAPNGFLRRTSYSRRCFASESTSYASWISLKRSSAWGLSGLRSGWYCRASFRYAFLISSAFAVSLTPRTL